MKHFARRPRGIGAARLAAFAGSAVLVFFIALMTPRSAGAQAPSAASPAAPPPITSPAAPPTSIGSPPTTVDEDIRDIRGPKYLAPVWLIPAIVGGVALLALLAYLIFRWSRRRRAPRVLTSSESALQRLEEIRVLMQPATVREFGIEVSDVVRRYIERGFDITATHRTTEEFLHDLLETTHPALTGHRDLLAGFLEQCDLAKFAGMALSAHSMETLHASARTFVIESSKPIAAAPTITQPAVRAA